MPPSELLLDVAPRLERLVRVDHMEVVNLLQFGMLGRVGILHGDDDTLGEEVLVDGNQVLLRHQHDGRSFSSKKARKKFLF